MPLFPEGPVANAKAPGIVLRAYQEAVLKKLRWHISHSRKRLLLVAPCASGKMVMFAAMIKTSTVPATFVAHRRELLDQLVRELAKCGITHVSVMRGDDDRWDPSATIQIASIQSLMRRDKPRAGLVFIDEAHRGMSESYQEHVFDAYPEAIIIGGTATPSRLDGQPLGNRFEAMEIATSYSELIRLKHLIEPIVFGAPVVADLSGVRINHGDFNEAELGQVMSQKHLRGQLVQHWIERAHLHKNERTGVWEPGAPRRTLIFASTVEHSHLICEDFRRASVRIAHLDGETPDAERRTMLAKLEAHELDIISNVNVLLEGIDIPSIKCVMHARPTQSLVLWIQSTARALRLWNGVTPLIFDHAGNATRHGMPHADRVWSLTAAVQRHPGEAPTKMCPKCFAYVDLARYTCPQCGFEFPERERRGPPKNTHESLVELTAMGLQRAFYDECVTKARTKGYKPSYASVKFRDKYTFWPPFGWSEATKKDYASDPGWQAALALKERRKAQEPPEEAMMEASKACSPEWLAGLATPDVAPPSPPPPEIEQARAELKPGRVCTRCGGDGSYDYPCLCSTSQPSLCSICGSPEACACEPVFQSSSDESIDWHESEGR
jgi:superfamily II DNA or RNA helicase